MGVHVGITTNIANHNKRDMKSDTVHYNISVSLSQHTTLQYKAHPCMYTATYYTHIIAVLIQYSM